MTKARRAEEAAVVSAAVSEATAPVGDRRRRRQLEATVRTCEVRNLPNYSRWFGDDDPRTAKIIGVRDHALAELAALDAAK